MKEAFTYLGIDPLLFALTFVGAVVLYATCRHQDIDHLTALRILNKKIDNESSACIILFDMVITSVVGTIIAYYATNPETNQAAITAGLSFTGIISTIRS